MNQNNWQGQSEDIKYLSEDELRRLLGPITKGNHQHHALFNLIYQFGLRASEAISMRIEDIDLDKSRILITRLKRKDKFRTASFPIPESLVEILKRWLRERRKHRAAKAGNPYLFLSQKSRGTMKHMGLGQLQHLFAVYAERAGIEKARRHVHTLRHSCGIMMAKSGLNAEEIRNRLGHVSMLSTDIYCRLAGPEREAAHGRAEKALEL